MGGASSAATFYTGSCFGLQTKARSGFHQPYTSTLGEKTSSGHQRGPDICPGSLPVEQAYRRDRGLHHPAAVFHLNHHLPAAERGDTDEPSCQYVNTCTTTTSDFSSCTLLSLECRLMEDRCNLMMLRWLDVTSIFEMKIILSDPFS